ncbi:MAG: type VI secretion system tube protein Hcp [Sideroxydans sp.]|nr:type VI secretion system tube protein Hcp [Sideroxydans sp.]
MDLILLQPGSPDFLGKDSSNQATEGNLIEGVWRDETRSQIENLPCLELVSIQQGMKQQVTTDVSNSARTSGRPIITEITCTKYVDEASVKLYDYCLRAMPLDKCDQGDKSSATKIFIIRNTGDKTASIMTFYLRGALISEIQLQSHPDDMPTEQFKINFTEIIWEYAAQQSDANLAAVKAAGWSIARNRPIGEFS